MGGLIFLLGWGVGRVRNGRIGGEGGKRDGIYFGGRIVGFWCSWGVGCGVRLWRGWRGLCLGLGCSLGGWEGGLRWWILFWSES